MAKASDIRNGLTIKHSNDIYKVTSFQHVKMGRGSGFYRCKLKSLTSGKVIEQSFNSSAKLETVRVERRKFEYLYANGNALVLMDLDSYEQIELDKAIVDGVDIMIEGMECEVLFNTANDSPLTVELPQYVIQTVKYTEPGVRGDTATNAQKPAKLESGVEIKVPLFINEGDKVKVEVLTKKYVERVKK